jgi:16S rRNA processing protein RimM
MLSDYILVGQVLKPQGILGLVKIQPLTDNPQRFGDLKQVYIKQSDKYSPIQITDIKVSGRFVFCFLDGSTTREKAENQRNMMLYVDRSHAVKIPDDANYVCDIINCCVIDKHGNNIGNIVDILSTGANDVYVIETSKGKMLVPALKYVVTDIDIISKQVTVDEERLPEVAVFED